MRTFRKRTNSRTRFMVPEHVRVRAAEDGDDDANRLKSIDYAYKSLTGVFAF